MRKQKKKWYISAKGYRKADYKKALATKYNIIFTDNLLEADFFIAPHDMSGLNESQKQELEQAMNLGIATKLIEDKFMHSDDPLELFGQKEHQNRSRELQEDLEEELEL